VDDDDDEEERVLPSRESSEELEIVKTPRKSNSNKGQDARTVLANRGSPSTPRRTTPMASSTDQHVFAHQPPTSTTTIRSPLSSMFDNTPRRRRQQQLHDDPLDPLVIPLPPPLAILMALHASLERTLLLHLATSGAPCLPPSPLHEEQFTVRLPNLATYRSVRPAVERGAGHRFGEVELARLLALWDEAGEERVGLTVSPHRELDRATGKKVYTYGIGIELRVRRNEQRPELEMVGVGGGGGVSRGSASVGMSVVALWSQGSEARREEVRKRLGRKVLQAYQVCRLLLYAFPFLFADLVMLPVVSCGRC
jgi:hypothetical protein